MTIYEFFTSFGTYSNNNLNGCIKVMRKSKFSQGALHTVLRAVLHGAGDFWLFLTIFGNFW